MGSKTNEVKFLCRTEKLQDLHVLQLACLNEGWNSTYKLYSLSLANMYSYLSLLWKVASLGFVSEIYNVVHALFQYWQMLNLNLVA